MSDDDEGTMEEEVVEEELEEDEDSEEDSEEEESEEEFHMRGRPTKKPRRQTPDARPPPREKNLFLVEEADVDDEDEEDELDEDMDDLGPEEGLEVETSSRDHRRANVVRDRDRQMGNRVDIASQIERRYAYDGMDEMDDEDLEERTPIRQQSFMPSVKDPKLWQVKVKPGKEREIVVRLLQKYINKETHPDRLLIKSAVCNSNISGYIYIEAEREAHVKAAIAGVPNTFEWKMKLVPIREMTDVLKPSKKKIHIATNSWVRVTRGLYRGDIGQVVSYDEAKLRATVRLIPRLGKVVKEVTEKKDDASKDPGSKKRKPETTIISRPPARFVNDDEALNNAKDGKGERNRFKDGYILKPMNIKSLETENVQPTVEEVQKFQSSKKLSSEDDAMSAISRTVKRKTTFTKGDTVEVIESDLKHLMGVVESVDGSDMVTIRPLHEDLKDLLSFHASDLKKHFKVGDHIKVITGRYEGETGLVVSINDNIVVIFSDLTRQEFKVLSTDIQECLEVSTGKLQLGNYELHDLVQLNPHTVGVIVKVESDSFKVLDNNGILQHVRLQEMGSKRFNKDATAFDKQQSPVGIGDVVSIMDGKYKGRQGTVRYVFRSYLFLHAKDMLDNSGIFVVRSGGCTLLGGGNKPNQARPKPQNQFPDYAMSPRGPGGGRGGGPRPMMGRGGGGRGRGNHDGMLYKTVTIIKGPYKGLVGIVKDSNDKVLRIELHTNCKTVTVEKTGVREHGEGGMQANKDRGDGGRRHDPRMGSGLGAWDVPRTPRDGSQTPLRMATPRRDGSMTPSHDPFYAPNTPMRPDTPGQAGWGDDNDDGGVPTPGVYGNYYSPAPYTSEPAYTPNVHPSTPSPFLESGTPFTPGVGTYADQHTPAADSPYSAPTPGTPSTPGITPATPSEGAGYDTGYDDGYGRKEDGDNNWQMTEIEVRVENEMFGNGAYKDKAGVIKEVYPDNSCRVYIYDRQEVITVPGDYLSSVTPGKRDKIKVIRGEFKGNTGSLIGLSGHDGIVKLDNGEIKILGIQFLAKLSAQ